MIKIYRHAFRNDSEGFCNNNIGLAATTTVVSGKLYSNSNYDIILVQVSNARCVHIYL